MSKGGKSVAFKPAPSKLTPAAENWVQSRGAEPKVDREEGGTVTTFKTAEATAPLTAPAKEKMARFTIDVPESLHRRIKTQCAARGTKMADVMRELMEREFPAS